MSLTDREYEMKAEEARREYEHDKEMELIEESREGMIRILNQNIGLPFKHQENGIMGMLEEKEKLIGEWIELGGTKESFFKQSRILVGVEQ